MRSTRTELASVLAPTIRLSVSLAFILVAVYDMIQGTRMTKTLQYISVKNKGFLAGDRLKKNYSPSRKFSFFWDTPYNNNTKGIGNPCYQHKENFFVSGRISWNNMERHGMVWHFWGPVHSALGNVNKQQLPKCIASSVVTHIFLLNFASLCGIIFVYYGMVWCGMIWYGVV